MDTITRVCRKCGQEKPLEEFVKDKECVLGHSHICKQCKEEQSRKRYAANPEKRREMAYKWAAANPEKFREWGRKWSAANPEKEREKSRKYREKLTDGYLIYQLKIRNLPITPETIDYKRIQLKLYREIKNQQNDERD